MTTDHSSKTALLSIEEMTSADQMTVQAGTPGLALMERAGEAIVEVLNEKFQPGTLLVLTGPGNNGGDGFVAARLAQRAGWRVRIGIWGDVNELRGEAAEMARRWNGFVRPATPELIEGTDVIIDALFGAGLSRPIEGELRLLVDAINMSEACVISADIPSGIDGNTGAVCGAAVRADVTVTFFRAKPGHFLMPGRGHCGELRIADIGIPESVLEEIQPAVFKNAPDIWLQEFPLPNPMGHKYHRGHTLVMSGGPLNTGAARLAAESALRIGAGLVTVLSPSEASLVNAAHLTAVMVRECDSAREIAGICQETRAKSVVIGPAAGINEKTRANVQEFLATDIPVVLDADALSVFQGAPQDLFRMMRGNCVLTPHEGEFDRLFPNMLSQAGSRVAAVREAARRAGAVTLLKGADTVIASPDGGMAVINTNAPPDLATAGAGDVLAGLIAGLLAQGMPAFEATCAAAWIHGQAARHFGRGLTAEDLPAMVPASLRDIDALLQASAVPHQMQKAAKGNIE